MHFRPSTIYWPIFHRFDRCFFEKIWHLSPSTISCPIFCRFDRYFFKKNLKKKAASRFRDAAFLLCYVIFLPPCPLYYITSACKAQGVRVSRTPGASLVFLPEEGIQQFFMLIALNGDVVAVGAGEIEEVAFGDIVLAAGFEGL